jgi:nicotinamidase-related amidase
MSSASVHAVIDLQSLFSSHPDWGVPTAGAIVDGVAALARHNPSRTLWTRYIPAKDSQTAKGCWRSYFEKWPRATLNAGVDVNLLPQVKELAQSNAVFDKSGYSAFENPRFLERLRALGADTLILSGLETDVCVLSTALGAIDQGFFVVLATDALTSFDLAAHRMVLDALMPRFAPQIRLATVAQILDVWR